MYHFVLRHIYHDVYTLYTVQLLFKGHSDERTPSNQGIILFGAMFYLPHVDESVMKVYLSFGDTFWDIGGPISGVL